MKARLISAFLLNVALIGAGAGGGDALAAKPLKLKVEAEPKGLDRLLHAGPETVKARLGDPAVARAEGKGAFWTYRAPRCALYIFFKDEGGGLKVSGAAAGPRKRGVTYPDLDLCLAELEQSQSGSRP